MKPFNYLSQELNEKFVAVRDLYGKDFSTHLGVNLESYRKAWQSEDVSVSMAGFDFTRAFASGLTGLSAYGALALWASIVAGGSNLGAYILVAKVVSFLGSLGISLGGTATVASAISAIGGPVTIAIMLAVISAVAAFGIISGTWKARVSNKIVKAFEKNNTLSQFLDALDEYWNDTASALTSALKSMHTQAKQEYQAKVDTKNLSYEEQIAFNTRLQILYEHFAAAYQRIGQQAFSPTNQRL